MTKKIEAIIREEALQDVKDALREAGIVGLNVHEVHGHGRQGGIELSWRGTSYQMDLLPKMQINIILSDHNVESTIETIIQAARTGKEGDGIIFIYPVDDARDRWVRARKGWHRSSSTCGRRDPHPHRRTGSGCADVQGRHRRTGQGRRQEVGAHQRREKRERQVPWTWRSLFCGRRQPRQPVLDRCCIAFLPFEQ